MTAREQKVIIYQFLSASRDIILMMLEPSWSCWNRNCMGEEIQSRLYTENRWISWGDPCSLISHISHKSKNTLQKNLVLLDLHLQCTTERLCTALPRNNDGKAKLTKCTFDKQQRWVKRISFRMQWKAGRAVTTCSTFTKLKTTQKVTSPNNILLG